MAIAEGETVLQQSAVNFVKALQFTPKRHLFVYFFSPFLLTVLLSMFYFPYSLLLIFLYLETLPMWYFHNVASWCWMGNLADPMQYIIHRKRFNQRLDSCPYLVFRELDSDININDVKELEGLVPKGLELYSHVLRVKNILYPESFVAIAFLRKQIHTRNEHVLSVLELDARVQLERWGKARRTFIWLEVDFEDPNYDAIKQFSQMFMTAIQSFAERFALMPEYEILKQKNKVLELRIVNLWQFIRSLGYAAAADRLITGTAMPSKPDFTVNKTYLAIIIIAIALCIIAIIQIVLGMII